jgi:hypothetical protein
VPIVKRQEEGENLPDSREESYWRELRMCCIGKARGRSCSDEA